MSGSVRGAVERGDFNEALARLAAARGVPAPGTIDFGLELNPRQDLVHEERRPDEKPRLAALALIRGARRGAAERGALATLEGAVLCAFGRFRQARRVLKSAEGAPAWARRWLFRAEAGLALAAKDVDALAEAERLSDALLRDDSDDFFVRRWRAELFTGFDLHAQALLDLDAMARLRPECGWAYAEMADIHTEHRRLERALLACGRLAALYPGQGWVYALRARTWGKCGRMQESMADLNRAARLGPPLGSALAWRGEARRQLGDLLGALEDFDAAERLSPRYALTYLWRGAARLKLGRLDAANADLTRALKLDPFGRLAYAWRGEALVRSGRFEEGLSDFDAFYPSSPRETWTGGPAAFWADLDRLVAAHPRAPLARACRGRFLPENPDRPLESARADLDAAVKSLPRSAWCRAWRGRVLDRLGEREAALRDLDAAARLRPRWPWAWAWRGKVKLDAGNHQGALLDFDRSLRLDPTAGAVYAWRAQALARAGDEPAAGRDRERAAALGFRKETSRPRAGPRAAGRALERA